MTQRSYAYIEKLYQRFCNIVIAEDFEALYLTDSAEKICIRKKAFENDHVETTKYKYLLANNPLMFGGKVIDS